MNTVELQNIADELDFDLEDVEMLIAVFIESVTESLVLLKDAIKDNNYDDIFKSAHAIKGSSANLTLMEISDLSKIIESESRESNEIDYLSLYNKLDLLIQKIK